MCRLWQDPQVTGLSRTGHLLLLLQVILTWVDTAAGAVIVPTSLKVEVTKVTSDGAVLTWLTSVQRRDTMTSCWLHYYPSSEAVHVQTEVANLQEDHIIMGHLTPNVTYYAFLNCTQGATNYGSNTVHFTPHGDPAISLEVRPPPPTPKPSGSSWASSASGSDHRTGVQTAGDGGIVVMMSQRHMDPPRRDPHSAVPSTSVILGAVCGVVGFLIINVTVVMAVRQYSHRRARRRRLLELQLEQHGGYLYNYEELMADYNQQINAGNT